MNDQELLTRRSARADLEALLAERIAILDGAMGTKIQTFGFKEADFRGERFRNHSVPVENLNDLLNLSQPDVIRGIHREYLDAGADIVETNTFNANAISLLDYGLEDEVYELNRAGAALAREAADAYEAEHPGQRRFVAGSIGPTNRMASMSPDVSDAAARATSFDELRAAFYEQARGLIDGGCDLLLPETSIDTLNLKAALFACTQLREERGLDIPLVASVTFTQEGSQRILSGQTLDAFWASIAHFDLLAVTVNCALGPAQMRAHVEELSRLIPRWFGCYPNAGLPNEFGQFDETPERVAAVVGEFARQGWLNLAGGCCGTTPAHIAAIAAACRDVSRREPPAPEPVSVYSGLETYTIRADSNFTLVGERTNVAGSRKFLKLVQEGRFEQAVEVARQQVQGGANVIDVNMDDGMIDGPAAMTRFLNQIAAEPDIASVPVMVDSSDWRVIEAGLKCLQGKGIVNSISLEGGEEAFLRKARTIRRYGAAMVVMGFDEREQAVTVAHKVAIAERAYRLLTEEAGVPPEDIIYDGNILPVATGIAEHAPYARNFIEAVRELKRRFPRMKTSGGLSNVSFSYRGNDVVREAMHAVFLYHAIQAGLTMAIVNAGQLAVYQDLDPELRERVEDVILDRRPDATERLTEFAERVKGDGTKRAEDLAWRAQPVEARLAHALLHGITKFVDEDVAEALAKYPAPLQIIEGPLMDGMGVVGELFGAGKMFLPQVVKSARVMQKAVAIIEPHLERKDGQSRGKMVIATVKGDVHDIGKNIVGVVLGCNGYEVVDLGVKVPAETILEAARREGADLIGLSGLITPSLAEMVHVAQDMQRDGFTCPLLIGGATTSRRHTAVKIAPNYTAGPVLHVLDASRAVEVVGELVDPTRREAFAKRLRAEQSEARTEFESQQRRQPLLTLAEARARRFQPEWRAEDLARPRALGVERVAPALSELIPFIDWTPFFHAWELKGTYPAILDKPEVGPRARELKAEADALLARAVAEGWLEARGVFGLFEAWSEGDDVVLHEGGVERCRLPMLRQQAGKTTTAKDGTARHNLSLADFVAPRELGLEDHVGAFVVTAGLGAQAAVARFRADHDEYGAIMIQALADRLAEAFAEWLHARVRVAWGYEAPDAFSADELIRERYRGIRPAPGYPACPDHHLKPRLFALLDATPASGVELTEGLAMDPAASVCGLYFGHPAARYFGVGKLGRDQVEEYAARMGLSRAAIERSLVMDLAYDPDA